MVTDRKALDKQLQNTITQLLQTKGVVNSVVDKWNEISDPKQKNEFKSLIQSYVRLYGYISQIITFEDIELEKLFIFLKYVNKKLPKGDPGFIDISGSVELSSLHIQKIGEYLPLLRQRPGGFLPEV